MLTSLLSGALVVLTGYFGVAFGKDLYAHKDELDQEDGSWITSGIIGAVVNFFDTLGIGSFAPTTAALRGFKQIQDRVLPGTLNVSCTIPVVMEALIFMSVIEVEFMTLFSMILAAVIGAKIGAGIISGLEERKIQRVMGVALLATAFIFFAGQMGWTAALGTGTATGLSGGKLVIAVVGNFILGALMTAGIGLYAPCMALVYALGMSPAVAFPIMMGSCAFLMPVASTTFIKEGAYNRKVALAITLGGIVGVIIAAYLVTSMPLDMLTWLVIVVITYTSITLLRDSFKPATAQE